MVSKSYYPNKRYQPKGTHVRMLLRHPRYQNVSTLRILIRRTGVFKGQQVGNRRVTVCLDGDNGAVVTDLYCPTTDYELRAKECAAYLRGYLQKLDARYVPVSEEEDASG